MLWFGVAWAGLPEIQLTWRGEDARLWVRPSAEQYVAKDAPLDVDLQIGGRSVMVAGLGADLEAGVALGEVRGLSVSGELALSVCDASGTHCQLLSLQLQGDVADRRRGGMTLTRVASAGGPSDEGEYGFPARVDASVVYERAVAEAQQTGRPILLDFGAVWCPPCNQLSAELLHAEPRHELVEAFVLAEVDVDDPSSWPLKDRFHVGGYPSLVAIDVDGRVLGRTVGYESREATLAWMTRVLEGEAVRPVPSPSPEQAAALAWQAVRDGRDDGVEDWMDLASAVPESVPYRLARFVRAPSLEDALWLRRHTSGQALQWVPAGLEASADMPELRQALRAALQDDLRGAAPLQAADMLYVRAALEDGSVRDALYGAAAVLVQSQLTGDRLQDKAHLGWLGRLRELSGDVEGAIAGLEQAREAWPDEPTFHLSLARLFLRQGRLASAHAVAERAAETAWGDNLLTATTIRVQALIAMEQPDEARRAVQEVLASLPEPEAALDVRSHRMRQKLLDLVAQLP